MVTEEVSEVLGPVEVEAGMEGEGAAEVGAEEEVVVVAEEEVSYSSAFLDVFELTDYVMM